VNAIVERERGLLELEERIADLKKHAIDQPVDLTAEIKMLEEKYAQIQRDIFGHLTPWQRVNMARHPKRPLGSAYLAALDQFDELHGDRHFGDDPAIIGGFAKLRGRRIIAIAQDKGVDTKEKVQRNFGMPPEGCAAILWGDAAKAEEAAARLRLTSEDLLGFGIVDEIVPEPLGGAHRDSHGTINNVLSSIERALARLVTVPSDELRARRYDKFRRIGAPA